MPIDTSAANTDAPQTRGIVAAYGLALLFIANVFNYADRALLGIVIEEVKGDLLLSDTQISIISGFAFSLFNLVAGIVLARWVDRGDRRVILVLGILVWTAATAATGYAYDFNSLAACRVMVGVGEATVFPVAMSLLADFYPGPKLQRSVAIFQSSNGVGIVAGSILAGVLAAALGWRTMFVVMGAAGVVVVILIAFTMPGTKRKLTAEAKQQQKEEGGLLRAIRETLAVPGLAWLGLGYSVAHMIPASLPTWGPALLQRSYGVALRDVGFVIGPAAVLGVVTGAIFSGMVATWLAERSGNRFAGLSVPILALPLAVPAFVLYLFSPSIPLLMLSILLLNFMISSTLGPCLAAGVSLVAPSRRGLTSTLILTLMAIIAGTIAPLIVGVISDALAPTYGQESLRYALAAMTVTPLLASFLLWFARRRFRKDEVWAAGEAIPS
jgi:MFS family permease